MLITEWDTEEAKKVWYQEGTERGIEIGTERGIEIGTEKGIIIGAEQEREKFHKKELHTAANLKMRGVSPDIITESTGLSAEEIDTL